jgi:hypothetical protein
VRAPARKYVHWRGFRPQTFNLALDPQELVDRGASPAHRRVRAALHARLSDGPADRKPRTTASDV